MNCDAAQRRLLAGERPDRPTDDVRRHLDGCPACRLLGRRLVQVERQIGLLPVPPSFAKDAFVRRFGRPVGPVVLHGPIPWPTPVKERGLRKLSLAVAIAAVLAVFAIGLWSWPHHFEPLTPTEFDHAKALSTPRERVEKLSALATDLQNQARAMALAGKVEDLASLTTLYSDLVNGDLLVHARTLSAAERGVVLNDVANSLGHAESEFSRLAAEPGNSATAESLRRLALAAGDGGRHIRDLLKGAA
jgi:Putative zinc-finger